jgi:hypothetical protein
MGIIENRCTEKGIVDIVSIDKSHVGGGDVERGSPNKTMCQQGYCYYQWCQQEA